MSSFSASALEILQAAEEALTQPHSVRSRKQLTSSYTHKGVRDNNTLGNCYTIAHIDPNSGAYHMEASETSTVHELQRQLSRAMRELIELRAELTAEREHRNETLFALGRQWKEEVMVAVHRRDAALQSDVAELEEKMTAQLRENNEGRLVLKRQLEEVIRATKIRDTDRFKLREELQETTRQVEERVEVALSQSTAARTDCSRQLEQERAALSQRLDSELLRLVEMRREDQRALQEARSTLQQDGQRTREEVRRVVQEVWESSAAALIKTANEPVEQLRAELRQCRAAVQSAEEKVADCVRTCQAECRLHTTTSAERLHALESKEAIATSRLDRAERKADGAYEAVYRVESFVQGAKDASERAQLQAASSVERAQKVEHALSDRDARLIAVESTLHAVSTAEGLKAEVEACKRQTGRLESRMDVTSALCERVEQLADKTVRQVNDFTDRIASCEKAVQRSAEVAQGVQESMAACQADCQQTRARHETTEGVVQRHTQLMTQLEQRIVGQESRLGLWKQQQDQHVKDQQTIQREVTERAEVTHAMATRAQQVSSDARAEVSRLERRLDDIDRGLISGATETTSLRGIVESLRTQTLEMQRQQQQQEDQLRRTETRMQECVAPLSELEGNVAQWFEQHESHVERLGQKVLQCEKKLHEMGGRVQDYLKDTIRHHMSESQRRLLTALNEGIAGVSDRVIAMESTVTEAQAKSGSMTQQVQSLQKTSTTLQHDLQALKGQLQTVRGHVEQILLHAEAQSSDHQQLATVQQDMTRLAAVQQRLQKDVLQLQEMMRTVREVQLPTASGGWQTRDATISRLGTSQAQTSSTEMARTNEMDSSSPSAHIPASGGGPRLASYVSTISPLTVMESQHTMKPTVTPPLVKSNTKAAPTLLAQQDQQRGSSNSNSKDSSVERPLSHLSAVSSVRPTEEDVSRLHSVAEPAAATASNDDEDDTYKVAQLQPSVKSLVHPQQTSMLPNLPAEGATSWSAAGETAEQLSAPAMSSSMHVSGPVNTSHHTVIRGFTTIDSMSSDSDTEEKSRQPQTRKNKSTLPPQEEIGAAEEHTDNASSELTAAVTLTSEAAGTPAKAVSGRRVQLTSTAQRRSLAMSDAWGNPPQQQAPSSSDSSVDNVVPVPARAAAPTGIKEIAKKKTAANPLGTDDDNSDVVQAVEPQSSENANSEDRVQDLPAVKGQIGDAWARQQGAAPSQTKAEPQSTGGGATVSAPAPLHPVWDDWDLDSDEDEDDEGDVESHVVSASPHPVAQAGSSTGNGSDAVIQMKEVEEIEIPDVRPPHASAESAETSTSSVALSQIAAATVRHRNTAIGRGGGGRTEELRPTERRTFVGSSGIGFDDSPAPRHVVPRHGQNTTSSSSSSAERAEALGLQAAPIRRPTPQVRQYTNFDDSTTSDDD